MAGSVSKKLSIAISPKSINWCTVQSTSMAGPLSALVTTTIVNSVWTFRQSIHFQSHSVCLPGGATNHGQELQYQLCLVSNYNQQRTVCFECWASYADGASPKAYNRRIANNGDPTMEMSTQIRPDRFRFCAIFIGTMIQSQITKASARALATIATIVSTITAPPYLVNSIAHTQVQTTPLDLQRPLA